jgi:hypothetical protein
MIRTILYPGISTCLAVATRRHGDAPGMEPRTGCPRRPRPVPFSLELILTEPRSLLSPGIIAGRALPPAHASFTPARAGHVGRESSSSQAGRLDRAHLRGFVLIPFWISFDGTTAAASTAARLHTTRADSKQTLDACLLLPASLRPLPRGAQRISPRLRAHAKVQPS